MGRQRGLDVTADGLAQGANRLARSSAASGC
jgi:hypothetical protein